MYTPIKSAHMHIYINISALKYLDLRAMLVSKHTDAYTKHICANYICVYTLHMCLCYTHFHLHICIEIYTSHATNKSTILPTLCCHTSSHFYPHMHAGNYMSTTILLHIIDTSRYLNLHIYIFNHTSRAHISSSTQRHLYIFFLSTASIPTFTHLYIYNQR